MPKCKSSQVQAYETNQQARHVKNSGSEDEVHGEKYACASQSGLKTVLLPTCKFTSKRYGSACNAVPIWTRHKRGHHACSCHHGHQVFSLARVGFHGCGGGYGAAGADWWGGGGQWVWCKLCCDCTGAVQGCQEREHWFERDAFDTGRRNHMNRHTKAQSPDLSV